MNQGLTMKVLVTGNKGYVGRILSDLLIKENIDAVGWDVEFYPAQFNEHKEIHTLNKDIRDITIEDLSGITDICHLGALSNDPLGEINSELTVEINYKSTIRLAELAKKAGVRKFVYSSSCSSYGANSEIVDENSELNPQTHYAKSKVNSELDILKLKSDSFFPVILRNATVYGHSSNLRLDLVVNNLTASAFTTGKVKLLSDGTAWRPILHVKDMARAFLKVINSSDSIVSGEVFNVGSNEENYTVKQIANAVEELVSNSEITFGENASKDFRSYKVDFSKIKKQLGFSTKFTVKDGINELLDVFKRENFTEDDFKSERFYRLAQLKSKIQSKELDNELRYQER